MLVIHCNTEEGTFVMPRGKDQRGLIVGPLVPYNFWHGVIPTSYFIFLILTLALLLNFSSRDYSNLRCLVSDIPDIPQYRVCDGLMRLRMFHAVIMSLSVHIYVHIGVMQASELCHTPFSYHI